MPIKIVILDDHQIVIDGLKLLLADHQDFSIVGEYTNGFKLLQDLKTLQTDLLN